MRHSRQTNSFWEGPGRSCCVSSKQLTSICSYCCVTGCWCSWWGFCLRTSMRWFFFPHIFLVILFYCPIIPTQFKGMFFVSQEKEALFVSSHLISSPPPPCLCNLPPLREWVQMTVVLFIDVWESYHAPHCHSLPSFALVVNIPDFLEVKRIEVGSERRVNKKHDEAGGKSTS